MNTKEQLSQYLKSNILIMNDTGCWYWKGTKSPAGTPVVHYKGETTTVVRMLHQLKYGEKPPAGSRIKHLTTCDDKQKCVNPDHKTFVHGVWAALDSKMAKKCQRPSPAAKNYFTQCWLWSNRAGATIQHPTLTYYGTTYKVRHLLFERYQGVPVPDNKRITVQCRQWGCVNPNHLYLGGYTNPITHKYHDLNSK